jgi:hypothetical protein
MFRDKSIYKKSVAIGSLFLELTFGVAALSTSDFLSIVFITHALIGMFTFCNEQTSATINFFHSYFSFLVIAITLAFTID